MTDADELYQRYVLQEWRDTAANLIPDKELGHLLDCPHTYATVDYEQYTCDYDTCWAVDIDAVIRCPHDYAQSYHTSEEGTLASVLAWMTTEAENGRL